MRLSWFSHIAVRYAAMLVAATLVPLAIVIIAYDRYASSLLDVISGTRAEQRIAVMHGRLTSFLEARFSQLDTLANYPDLPLAFAGRRGSPVPGVRAVLEYEADNPDLYGILVFNGQDKLIDAIPSQAAAGAPYWGGRWEPLQGAQPRIDTQRGTIIGPFLPVDGQPGALLILRYLPSGALGEDNRIAIALHVRLGSLTELLGREEADGVLQPLLLAPRGPAFSAVGKPEPIAGELLKGPELLPGWQAALAVASSRLEQPLADIREFLLAAALLIIGTVAALVAFLGMRLNRRIAKLVDGSAALAEGRLDTRIFDDGHDELTELAGAFNRMAARQRDTLSAVVKAEKMAVLGRFATSFAHEVRNPLAAVKTSVQAMLVADGGAPHRKLLNGMDEEIDRLDESLRDFLAYARPAPPAPRRVLVEHVLRRCETLVAHQLAAAGISLTMLGETGLALHVDAGHVQQILMNLVANAIDAMPEGGRMTLRVKRARGMAVIEVSDTGHGIEADLLKSIMEPFMTTRAEGAGLGLPISRQLAELNKGSLTLDSEAGHGTTAILTLPRDGGGEA
jgi:two-component system sensor histidine kinase AtoS